MAATAKGAAQAATSLANQTALVGKSNQVLSESEKAVQAANDYKAKYLKDFLPTDVSDREGVGTLQSEQIPYGVGEFGSGFLSPSTVGLEPFQQPGILAPTNPDGTPRKLSNAKMAQWINLQTAINEKAAAQWEARQRGNAILRDYGTALQNNRTMTNQMLANNAGYGDTQREQLVRDYTKRLAASGQSAMRRGLGNTTVRDAMSRGVGADYDFASSQLAGQVADRRNALYASGIERENAALRDRNTFLGSIENKGPSTADIAVARAAYAKK